MRVLRAFALSGLFAGAIVVTGCGDGLRRVPVEGKVTAAGQVVDNATILFMPTGATKGEGGIGRTDDEGKYWLTGSRDGAKGVVPGEYKVRISRMIDKSGKVLPADAKQVDYPTAIESVPGAYGGPEPPLKVTVPESGGTLDIELPVKLIGKK